MKIYKKNDLQKCRENSTNYKLIKFEISTFHQDEFLFLNLQKRERGKKVENSKVRPIYFQYFFY